METSIKEFLFGDGYGYGSGDGSGYGSGDGYGYGSGDGYGYGSGYGSGDGYGYGSGDGENLKKFKGQTVYYIDGIPCLFVSVKRDSARILVVDNITVETTPAFIAKQAGKFAHGETLHEAFAAVTEKVFEGMDFEEKKKSFFEKFPSETIHYKTADFYQWHHIVTGSCEFGRKQFAREHGIDLNGDMTVKQFINLTRSAYGGDRIKELESLYH